MKTAFTLLALMMLPLWAGASARGWDDGFTPRDPVVSRPGQREWTWDGKDGLAIEAPVTVNYTPAGTPRIVVTGPEEVLAHVRVGQGHIRLDQDVRVYRTDGLVATVTGVTVRRIALAGSGRASLEGLDLDTLQLAIMGSGQVKASGRADRIDLSVAGSGNADLARLQVLRANINVQGSGNVELSPRDQANLMVAGSGMVRMASRPPRLSQTITGSGGVRFH